MLDETSGLNKRIELRQRCLASDKGRSFDANLDRLVSLLGATNLLSKEDDDLSDEEDMSQSFDTVRFGRQMQVPLTSDMELGVIQAMNNVCIAEAELVNLIHDATTKEVLQKAKVSGTVPSTNLSLDTSDLMTMFKVSKDNINRRTEHVFDSAGLVEHIDFAQRSARWFPIWIQTTLEDFADICDRPNSLEVTMLARFFEVSLSEVYEWFRLKRIENKAQKSIQSKLEDRAGHTARMCRAWQSLGMLGVATDKLKTPRSL